MKRLNPKRADRAAVEKLLDKVDGCADPNLVARRAQPWRPYRVCPLKVELIEPAGTTRQLDVIGRNLSVGGMSFLYAGFLHIGSTCTIQLITVDNAWHSATGIVRRCHHVGGPLHEIGVQFSEAVDTARFIPIKVAARILIAEDDPAVSRMCAFILRKAEAEVVLVEDGKAAVEQATASPFDLILMDLNMPELDGLAASRAIRASGISIPILALTGRQDEGCRQECLDAGCTDYLAKPIARHELLEKVLFHLNAAPPLLSVFAVDPEMHDIVDAFVAELPKRSADCQDLLSRDDRAGLLTSVRDLKGALGSHEFPVIAEAAGEVESLLIAASGRDAAGLPKEALLTDGKLDDAVVSEELHRRMNALAALASRARTSTPD